MQLRVKDIEELWKNGCASLVAGKRGENRKVDFYDMMEQPDIKPWLREHLLVITTGYAIRNDKEALLKLIRDLNEVNVSALAIKTRFFDEFPAEALQLADELNFPLFLLNNNSGFSEIVYPVMVAIVEAKNQLELDERYRLGGGPDKRELASKLFMELQMGKITQIEEADYRTNSLQWPVAPLQMLVLKLVDKETGSGLLEMKWEEQNRAADAVFSRYQIPYTVVCRKERCICIIRSGEQESRLNDLAKELHEKTEEVQKCRAVTLISDEFRNYLELGNIYRAIDEGFFVQEIQDREQSVMWLKDLQYERILLHCAQSDEVRKFVRNKLGVLEQYDREHDSHLVKTLEVLLKNNGSRKLAAEALFLHRNTMSYRLRQLEDVLGCNLGDAEQLMELQFASKIRKYIRCVQVSQERDLNM